MLKRRRAILQVFLRISSRECTKSQILRPQGVLTVIGDPMDLKQALGGGLYGRSSHTRAETSAVSPPGAAQCMDRLGTGSGTGQGSRLVDACGSSALFPPCGPSDTFFCLRIIRGITVHIPESARTPSSNIFQRSKAPTCWRMLDHVSQYQLLPSFSAHIARGYRRLTR